MKGGETSLHFEKKREGAPSHKVLGVHAGLLTENERTQRIIMVTAERKIKRVLITNE